MTGEDSVKSKEKATATFAGGCFWCMEPPFDAEPGVHETIVGYTGGSTENPTYKQVPALTFYPAEEYHQEYYKKNPIRYKFYRRGCRRDKRLAELWETN